MNSIEDYSYFDNRCRVLQSLIANATLVYGYGREYPEFLAMVQWSIKFEYARIKGTEDVGAIFNEYERAVLNFVVALTGNLLVE